MTDSLFPEPETLFSEPEHEPLWSALQLAGDKPPADADRGEKKNYAQRPVSYTHLTLPTNREV